MYILKPIALIPVAIAIFIASCSKDDAEPRKAAEGTMIASINGTEWMSDEPVGLIYFDQINITAVGSDNSKVVIYLANDEAGTHSISGLPNSIVVNVASYTPPDASVRNPVFLSTRMIENPAGSVHISEIDSVNKTITGTFNFKAGRSVPADSSVEIKTGSFTKIPYSDIPGIVAGNEVHFDINGTAFSAILISSVESTESITVNTTGVGGRNLSFTIPANIAPGTYTLEPAGSQYTAMYVDNGTIYQASPGSMEITSHDVREQRIEGKFSFTGKRFPDTGESVVISEGSFKIRY